MLEGPKAAVKETFARISCDPKHRALRLLIEQETDDRLFSEWSMGFERLDPDQARTTDIFAITRDAIENAVLPEKAAQIAILLRNFYRVNAGSYAA